MSNPIFISLEWLYDQNMAGTPPLQAGASTTEVTCHPSSLYEVHCAEFIEAIRSAVVSAGFVPVIENGERLKAMVSYDGDPARQDEVTRLIDAGLFDFWKWLDRIGTESA